MNPESMPEIPGLEHPEHGAMKESAEALVKKKVDALDVGLDLERHPELRSRLAEIGSHFDDSVEMAEIIRTVYGELKGKLGLADEGPERLMRAAILHDIGKSGPAGEKGSFHDAVRRLFVQPRRRFNPYIDGRAKTIREFAEEQNLAEYAKISSALAEAGIDPDREPMIDFWRRHAEWTHGILKESSGPDIDEKLIAVASSHHLLENQNPAHVDINSPPPDAQVLETLEEMELLAAVDKYQAFRRRGGEEHESALAKLKSILNTRLDLPEALRSSFQSVIEVLDRYKDALAKMFGVGRGK
jgi:hypothetical protein